jgi:hypothetical protein
VITTTKSPVPPNSPNATPRFRTFVRSIPKMISFGCPGSTAAIAICFVI